MKFCDNCQSMLSTRFTSESMSFICPQCLKTFEATPQDTLLYQDTNSSMISNILPYVKHASQDITNARTYRDCKKCKGKIMQQLVIGPNCKIVFVCINKSCAFSEYV